MRGSLGAYREVSDNLSEGLRFYMSLQEAIGTLGQQAGDYALTRRLQRCAPRAAADAGADAGLPASLLSALLQLGWASRGSCRHGE